ncbi:hypothetical protein [Streptomyces griseocarneus]|uniref:hypothetical protein n=1 Tax=Streptomyces griseocarneus TaxID=51201 RepID=UPI00167D94AB|nr:hypothetical protein [Streptomyces griseocarneus]MBZ6476829.1 hypothetical protein [Streptomyces griseocarneus]GHG81191.1 hypothetical protein GCM10018779_63220 [Streptomyces griseocarneus]
MTNISVHIRPSLIALPFHRAFTRPVVEVDGVERQAAWGTTEVAVDGGTHRLAVYFRYRGQRTARLGEGHAEFTVDGSVPEIRVTARLGSRNGSHFRVVVGDR